MDQTQYQQAVKHLVDARRSGQPTTRFPEHCRPGSVDDALMVQARVGAELEWAVGGWKCALPTPDKVVVAPLYRHTITSVSPCPVAAPAGVARTEPEIALILGKDLPARAEPYTEADIRDAVAESRLVLELLGTRFVKPEECSFPELLADGQVNQGLFLGPVLDDALNKPLEQFTLTLTGAVEKVVAGRHPNGHPLAPATWLANFLSQRQQGLQAGQIIITGSYAGVIEVPLNQPVTWQYGELGQFEVSFTGK